MESWVRKKTFVMENWVRTKTFVMESWVRTTTFVMEMQTNYHTNTTAPRDICIVVYYLILK